MFQFQRRATAREVARYFLANQDEEAGELISNLKLQKLIYYAQGFHLAVFGQPLFGDKIKAWAHGPVVPDVWHTYKNTGWGAIGKPDNFELEKYSKDTRDLLDEVNRVYGQYSATKLRDMTHEEPPWKEAWERVQRGDKDDEIKHDAMRKYFSTLVE